MLKMVYCVNSFKSPQRGESSENTQHAFKLQKIKEILIMPPDLALLSTLTGSNYPCFQLIFMVPKMFEPLDFDCIYFNLVMMKQRARTRARTRAQERERERERERDRERQRVKSDTLACLCKCYHVSFIPFTGFIPLSERCQPNCV